MRSIHKKFHVFDARPETWMEVGLCCFVVFHGGIAFSEESFSSDGVVELGVGVVDLDNPNSKYGEYTGISDDDSYLIGNIEATVEKDLDYFELNARDIDLDARQLSIGAGREGIYSLSISHDNIPHLISSNARSPFDGIGGERLTLPGGFVQSATTSGMINLNENLKTFDLRTDRAENTFRVSRTFRDGWRADLSVRREDKTGVQSLGGITAQNGGLVDSTILPQPIDYSTEEFAATMAFDGDDKQLEIGYFLSMFHNENSSITWDVPFLKATVPAIDYPAVARIGLPPDNKYQRFNISGGINFTASTRISAVIEAGRTSQDDLFLPYSTDDIGGTAAITQDGDPLPRSSAEAEVDVIHLTLNLASQPAPRLGLNARYRFYETDNKTPYTLFDRVINDTVPQSLTTDIYSRPYDYSQSEFQVGANYRFKSGVNLNSDYGYKVTDYGQYRSVSEIVEDTLEVGLRKNITDDLSGRLEYVHGRRDAGDYDAFRSYSTLFPSQSCPSIVIVNPDPDTGGITPVDTCFDNHPDIRQFDIASRDQNRVYASLAYNPYETIDIGLDISDSRADYDDNVVFDDTYLGLTSDDSLSVTVDLSYTPDASWSVSTYYTNEKINSIQTGRAYNATASSAIDSSFNWNAEFDEEVDTVGVRSDLDILYDSLALIINYAYTKGVSQVEFMAGSGLTYEDMPEDRSKRHTVDVSAVYKMRDDVRLGFGIGYEKFKSSDWSIDSVEAGGTALNDVLLLTGPREDYHAYLVSATLIYSW